MSQIMLMEEDGGDFGAGFLAFGAWPEGIDMVHLVSYMQTGIYAGGFHLVVGVDDVGIEIFPCAGKEVDGRQALHITLIRAVLTVAVRWLVCRRGGRC